MKYKLLLAALVLLITEFILQFLYFLKIEPDVITSCCGVMFSEKGKGIASSLASFPPLPAMILFYSLFAVTTATGAAAYKQQRKPFTYLLSIFTFMFFIFSIAAIISFISLYFYQLPTHHCPFDILQKEYYYIGYPLYAFLFAGSFLGIMAGVVERFKKIPSMNRIIPAAQKRWALYSIIFLTIFTLIASAPIILLPFRLY